MQKPKEATMTDMLEIVKSRLLALTACDPVTHNLLVELIDEYDKKIRNLKREVQK